MSLGHASYVLQALAGQRLAFDPGTRAHAALTVRMELEKRRSAAVPAALSYGQERGSDA